MKDNEKGETCHIV